MLMMICAKYVKNASKIVDFFSRVKAKKLEEIAKKLRFSNFVIT